MLANLGCISAILEHRGGLGFVEPYTARNRGQNLFISDVFLFRKVALEQRHLELGLLAMLPCPGQQLMREEGVVDALALVEVEREVERIAERRGVAEPG